MMMRRFQWFVGALLCVASVSTRAEAAGPSVFKSLDPAKGQLPESITSDKFGNIYLSMGTTVGKITPSGQLSTYSNIPVPEGTFTLGLEFGPDGYLYASTGGFTPDPAVAYVWRIDAAGHAEEYAELDPNGFPNDLAFDDCGQLYVTDPFLGLIWKIDEDGNPDVWLADPLLEANYTTPYLGVAPFGADGIAFDRFERNLYIGNLDYGRIIKVGLDWWGEPDDVEVYYENIDLIGGADGLAFDALGRLYVAVHGQDRIVRVDRFPRKGVVVASGAPLQQPSALVFGETLLSRHTLYISNFSILAALGAKPGPPKPALLKLPVLIGGL